MRQRAADTGEMAGSDDPRFDEDAVGPPFAATVTVYRLTQGQRFAYTATARWSEYKPAQNDFMWRKMPHTMLGKCAEALALRKGFPRQLAGLYAKEELEQVNVEPVMQIREAPPSGPATNGALSAPAAATGENRGTTADNGVDPGVDLPPGTVRVAAVGAGKAGAKGEITFSTGESYLTWEVDAMSVARHALADQFPVTVELKTSASGNTRVHKLTPVGLEQAF